MNDKVNKLVLFAPSWTWKSSDPPASVGNYRTVQRDVARARVISDIPKGREEEISPMASFEKSWAANLASDPDGAKQNPSVLRAPNGVRKDSAEYWGKG